MSTQWVPSHPKLPVMIWVSIFFILIVDFTFAADLRSGDGYIRKEDNRWVIGTAMVEKTISLNRGSLTLTSFKNKASQREYVQGGVASGEIRLTANGEEYYRERWQMDFRSRRKPSDGAR